MKSYCPFIFNLLFGKIYKRPRPLIKGPCKKSKNLKSTQGASLDHYGIR